MKEVIEHLERMAETLDGVTEENWLDTPQDIAQIYRSVANEIRQKMLAQNQSVTNCNQLKIRKALESALPIMRDCPFTHYNTTEVDKVVRDMEAALSTPPRNCDVYETKAERQSAFINWYNETFDLKGSEYAIDTCDLKHNIDDILHEYIVWLFSEAKGEQK